MYKSKMAKRAAGFVIFRKMEQTIEYLLLKASYGTRHWTPPKGHVDPGESDWVTALRETEEEAGLKEQDLEIYQDICKTLQYPVKGKPKEVVYWLARLKDPQTNVRLSEEHTELQWATLCEAQKLVGFETTNEMLREFDVIAQKISL